MEMSILFAKALLSNIRKVTDDGVKTTAKESDFEIKYADNITGKKVTAGKRKHWLYLCR